MSEKPDLLPPTVTTYEQGELMVRVAFSAETGNK